MSKISDTGERVVIRTVDVGGYCWTPLTHLVKDDGRLRAINQQLRVKCENQKGSLAAFKETHLL